jgi:hypothetical protein
MQGVQYCQKWTVRRTRAAVRRLHPLRAGRAAGAPRAIDDTALEHMPVRHQTRNVSHARRARTATQLHQHTAEGYSCERRREMNLFNSALGRAVILIRYNPDAFKTGSLSATLQRAVYFPSTVLTDGNMFARVRLFYTCSCDRSLSLHSPASKSTGTGRCRVGGRWACATVGFGFNLESSFRNAPRYPRHALAFAMALYPRLGAGRSARELDPKIVCQIGQQFVGPCWGTVQGYDDHGNDDCGSMRNLQGGSVHKGVVHPDTCPVGMCPCSVVRLAARRRRRAGAGMEAPPLPRASVIQRPT